MSKSLVEESFHLSTSVLKRSIARCGDASGVNIDDQFVLFCGQSELNVNYWLESEARSLAVNLCVVGNEPQRVELVPFELSFGTRYFFECPDCLRQVAKLYLPQGELNFKCRHCHRLAYELTRMNRNSTFGQLAYKQFCLDRFLSRPSKNSRVFYGNHYTKSYERKIKLYRKLGLPESSIEESRRLWQETRTIKQ